MLATITIDPIGDIRYFNENNKLHRKDGPAIIWSDSTKMWYVNGARHRLDGPAIEYVRGRKEWWINGLRYTRDEFLVVTEILGKGC